MQTPNVYIHSSHNVHIMLLRVFFYPLTLGCKSSVPCTPTNSGSSDPSPGAKRGRLSSFTALVSTEVESNCPDKPNECTMRPLQTGKPASLESNAAGKERVRRQSNMAGQVVATWQHGGASDPRVYPYQRKGRLEMGQGNRLGNGGKQSGVTGVPATLPLHLSVKKRTGKMSTDRFKEGVGSGRTGRGGEPGLGCF